MRKHPLANCEQCPLYDTGTYVAPQESRKVNVAIVTGIPYDSEQFAGGFNNAKAGALVANVMHHHGIFMSDTLHINAIACRPPEGTKVSAKMVAACRPRVIAQLEESLSKDGKALLMGTEAVQSVGPPGGVTEARMGPPKLSPWVDRLVVPTVNPYLCMRQQQHFPSLVTDIGKLVLPQAKFDPPEYNVVDNEEDALHLISTYIDELTDDDELTIDIECKIDKETSYGHPDKHDMLCIGIKFNENIIQVLTDNVLTPSVYALLKQLMHSCCLDAHNGKFDLNGSRPLVGRMTIGFDTMLASYAFDERAGAGNFHGLKSLAQEYLGAPAYDKEIEKYTGTGDAKDFGKVPKPLLYKYNAYDVHCTRLLKRMYQKMLEEAGQEIRDLYARLLTWSDLLMDLEYNGISVDLSYMEELSKKLEHSLLLKEYKLSLAAYKIRPEGYEKGNGINPRSPLQIKKFFNDCGIGLKSTDEETLTKIINYKKDFPEHDALIRRFAQRILDYRSDQRVKSTYVDGISQRAYKNRVHSSYLLHGTTTGRTSSRNPNLQNIPRNSPVKRLFVASEPDRVICNVDYSQAELRNLTFFAQEPYFQEIFNDPRRDVFDELVPEMFPGANKLLDDPVQFKEQRTMVKTYVYGLSYGRTEYGIARGFGISVDLAKKHKQRFFATIPNIIAWQNWVKRSVLQGDDLVSPYGRHRRYALITDENQQDIMNEALAFLPQSTSSDMCLTAAVEMNNEWLDYDTTLKAQPKIVNMVHDCIMFECHIDDAERLCERVSKAMVDASKFVVGDYVKFATDYSYAYSWGDIK